MELEENDKAVVLQILKDSLKDYNKTPPNEIDTEFKKKLEKDINVFQNYVNYQSAGRREKKTRKKRGGKRRKKKTIRKR